MEHPQPRNCWGVADSHCDDNTNKSWGNPGFIETSADMSHEPAISPLLRQLLQNI